MRGLILKPERGYVFQKNGSSDFPNSPPFQRSAYFYMTICENFAHFEYLNFETDFLENETIFQKNWSTAFQSKALRLETHYCNKKLPNRKSMLTLFRMRGWREGRRGEGMEQKCPATSFSPVTSTNVRISPKNFLTFSLKFQVRTQCQS